MKFSIKFSFGVCLILMFLFVGISSVSAKKKPEQSSFTFEEKTKFKPQNLKILKRVWSQGLKSGGSKKRYYPEDSDPTVMDGMIYVGTHGAMFYALSESDGKIRWKYKHDEPIASSAAVDVDKVVFADLGGKVVCLDRTSGALVWSQQFDGEMLGRPLIVGSSIYLLKGEQEVISLSVTDGHMQWNKLIRTYIKDITMRGHSSMVADGGALYLGLADGHLYKLNSQTGAILWDKNLTVPLRTFKDIDGAVVISGDSLYVGGYFGAVYRLNKSSGQVIWSNDAATGGSVAVIDDVVVASDINGSLVGIDRNTGKQLWFNELNGEVLSEPVEIDGRVFVSTYKSNAYLIDPENGNQVQKISLGDGSINNPVVSGDQVHVLTNGAQIVSLRKI